MDVDADTEFILHGPSRVWDRHQMVRNQMVLRNRDSGERRDSKEIPIHDSIRKWGVREQDIPPFAPIGDDVFAINQLQWLTTWLVMRSDPIGYTELTFPLHQNNADIERIEPGAAFNLRIADADDIDIDDIFFCVGCTLEKPYAQPAELHVQAINTSLARTVDGFILGRSVLGRDRLGSG